MMEDEPVYASKAKPWLKYYEEKYIHQSVPECSAFALICRNNERHLGDTDPGCGCSSPAEPDQQ